MSQMSTREYIFGTIEDLVVNFLYYDRKEDEELKVGDIERAINQDALITVDQIVNKFREALEKGIKE